MMTRARKRDGSDFRKLLVTVCGDKSGSEVRETYGRCLPPKIVRKNSARGKNIW